MVSQFTISFMLQKQSRGDRIAGSLGTSKSEVQKDGVFEVVSLSNLMAVKETPV